MLINKLIIITGGTSGIGHAIAKYSNKDNATIIITSRNIDIHDNQIEIGKINKQYLDVSNSESITKFFNWIAKQQIRPEIFINNAGIGVFKDFTEISESEVKNIIDTNLMGSFLCAQQASKLMKTSGNGGRIINIGSIVELGGISLNSIYAATKAGVRAMSLVISQELYKYNITSTHIALGAVYSSIWDNREGFCRNDMLDVEHVAQAIINLIKLPHNVRIDYLEIVPPKKIL